MESGVSGQEIRNEVFKVRYYRTSEIANAVHVHPNTVRLYEEWGLLMPVPRDENGYRRYSQAHLEQMRLARYYRGTGVM